LRFVGEIQLQSSGSMHFIICWLLHQKQREVLLKGVLPWGIDAVVFCWRCDRMRGRAVRVLHLTPQGMHACSQSTL
jgi:hypothetical protein